MDCVNLNLQERQSVWMVACVTNVWPFNAVFLDLVKYNGGFTGTKYIIMLFLK